MAKIKTGQNNRKVPQRKLLPTGKYLCAVQWVEKSMAAKSGKARLRWEFNILVGENKGKSIYDDTYLTEESLWRVENLVEALGFPEGFEFDPDEPEELLNTFVGKKVKIRLDKEEYVAQVGPNAGKTVENRKVGTFDAIDPEVAQRLAAKRRARFGDTSAADTEADDVEDEDDGGEVEENHAGAGAGAQA